MGWEATQSLALRFLQRGHFVSADAADRFILATWRLSDEPWLVVGFPLNSALRCPKPKFLLRTPADVNCFIFSTRIFCHPSLISLHFASRPHVSASSTARVSPSTVCLPSFVNRLSHRLLHFTGS